MKEELIDRQFYKVKVIDATKYCHFMIGVAPAELRNRSH